MRGRHKGDLYKLDRYTQENLQNKNNTNRAMTVFSYVHIVRMAERSKAPDSRQCLTL
mgnify:CR=1 FL=1